MIADIEARKVNMVITKDLSRLGRDYILTGHYMERYFPEHRVRYISLLDGIDTGVDSTANDITPFRAIMNDMYAKDISKKISSVMTSSARAFSSAANRSTATKCTRRRRTRLSLMRTRPLWCGGFSAWLWRVRAAVRSRLS